jgi:hypothetical protein
MLVSTARLLCTSIASVHTPEDTGEHPFNSRLCQQWVLPVFSSVTVGNLLLSAFVLCASWVECAFTYLVLFVLSILCGNEMPVYVLCPGEPWACGMWVCRRWAEKQGLKRNCSCPDIRGTGVCLRCGQENNKKG